MRKQRCNYGVKWIPCDTLEYVATPNKCKHPAKKGGMCKKHFKETGEVKRFMSISKTNLPIFLGVNSA